MEPYNVDEYISLQVVTSFFVSSWKLILKLFYLMIIINGDAGPSGDEIKRRTRSS